MSVLAIVFGTSEMMFSSLLPSIKKHWGVLLALGFTALSAALYGDFVTDDALISLRYSRMLAEGHGLRWNVGEGPVEGYSNFTHVLLGALAIKADLPALQVLRIFNMLSLGAVSLLSYLLSYHMLKSTLWSTFAACLIGFHPAFGFWAASGLETASYTMFALWGLYLSRDESRPITLWTAIPFLLLSATRPEGPIFAVAVLGPAALFALRDRNLKPLMRHLPWFAVYATLFGLYFAMRYAYFGHLFSNSTYYKSGFNGEDIVVHNFAIQAALPLFLMLFAPYGKLGRLGLTLLSAVAAYLVGFYQVAPSVFQLHRFLLPIVPPVFILAAAALYRFRGTGKSKLRTTVAAALAVGLVLFDLCHPYCGVVKAREKIERLNGRMEIRAEVAATIQNMFPSTYPIAMGDCGAVGFILKNPILDIFGLNSEEFIHKYKRKRKKYVKKLFKKNPAVVVMVSKSRDKFVPLSYSYKRVHKIRDFDDRYKRMFVFDSKWEKFNYFIFVRRDLAAGIDPKAKLSLDFRNGVAEAIDRLAQ